MTGTVSAPTEIAGPLQTEILCIMWDPVHKGKEWTVNAVHALVNTRRDNRNLAKLAYTTILTVMRNLAKRQFLDQVKGTGHAHIFTPKITRSEYEHTVLQTICTTLFDGHSDQLEQAAMRFRQNDPRNND